MNEFILVGVDGSAPSRVAVEWAMTRAARLGHDVKLIHVCDDNWGSVGFDMAEELARDSRQLLDETVLEQICSPG